jgi:hypothetical protein
MKETLISGLSALMYYDHEKENGNKHGSFESLPVDVQDKWTARCENVLLALDKCNMKVVDKKSLVTREERQKELNGVVEIIEGFVKNIDFKKLNSHNYFPSKELGMRICG